MSAKTELPAAAERPIDREIIVGFSPENVKAPLFLRCGALMLDYLLVVAFPVIFLLLGRINGYDGAKLLISSWSVGGWLIGILFAATNFIVLPVFSGQSIGKIAAGLRIVKLDGTPVGTGHMVLRQTAGYILTLLSAGIGFFISVFSEKGRALHDYMAGTVVIYAERNIRQ